MPPESEPAEPSLARAAAAPARLVAEGLSVELGRTRVLDGVGLRLSPGRVLAVLGPSGAGKSTLFRCLAGELVPGRGRVLLDDVDVTDWPLWRRARRGVGYVPQTPSLLTELSVAANIESFGALSGRAVQVRERAESIGLGDRLAVKARDLSGGERRRLELLRALIPGPAVLLCDEPLSGVDPGSARQLAALLRAHARTGAAVLLADHRVAEALELADEALLLVDGRVQVSGPAAGFVERSEVRDRLLGSR